MKPGTTNRFRGPYWWDVTANTIYWREHSGPMTMEELSARRSARARAREIYYNLRGWPSDTEGNES